MGAGSSQDSAERAGLDRPHRNEQGPKRAYVNSPIPYNPNLILPLIEPNQWWEVRILWTGKRWAYPAVLNVRKKPVGLGIYFPGQADALERHGNPWYARRGWVRIRQSLYEQHSTIGGPDQAYHESAWKLLDNSLMAGPSGV